jgi:hypothetical protein
LRQPDRPQWRGRQENGRRAIAKGIERLAQRTLGDRLLSLAHDRDREGQGQRNRESAPRHQADFRRQSEHLEKKIVGVRGQQFADFRIGGVDAQNDEVRKNSHDQPQDQWRGEAVEAVRGLLLQLFDDVSVRPARRERQPEERFRQQNRQTGDLEDNFFQGLQQFGDVHGAIMVPRCPCVHGAMRQAGLREPSEQTREFRLKFSGRASDSSLPNLTPAERSAFCGELMSAKSQKRIFSGSTKPPPW